MFPLIAGMAFFALGIALAHRNWRRSKTWSPAQAITQVRGTEKTKWIDGSTDIFERVRFRFSDRHGGWHSFDVRDNPGIRKQDEQVPVFYDPGNPDKAMIGTAGDMYGWACGLGLLGAWGVIIGCLVIYG